MDDARISSPVAGGLKLYSVLMLRHMTALLERPALLAEEHVVRGVGDAQVRASLVAGALRGGAALGVDALDCRHAGKQPRAASLRDLELEPRDVFGRGARRPPRDLAHYSAAVAVLPARSRVVAAHRLAVEEERRDGLAELPPELAARVGLAL